MLGDQGPSTQPRQKPESRELSLLNSTAPSHASSTQVELSRETTVLPRASALVLFSVSTVRVPLALKKNHRHRTGGAAPSFGFTLARRWQVRGGAGSLGNMTEASVQDRVGRGAWGGEVSPSFWGRVSTLSLPLKVSFTASHPTAVSVFLFSLCF